MTIPTAVTILAGTAALSAPPTRGGAAAPTPALHESPAPAAATRAETDLTHTATALTLVCAVLVLAAVIAGVALG